MKCFVVLLSLFCFSIHAQDNEQKRVLLHYRLNTDFDYYLDSHKSRYLPLYGGCLDFWQSVDLKRQYAQLFTLEMQNESQWNNYISDLQVNSQSYKKFINNLIYLNILWIQVTIFSGLLAGILYLRYDNDYYVSLFSALAGFETSLRFTALYIISQENKKIEKLIKSKFPRLKHITVPDKQIMSADVESIYVLVQ